MEVNTIHKQKYVQKKNKMDDEQKRMRRPDFERKNIHPKTSENRIFPRKCFFKGKFRQSCKLIVNFPRSTL